MRCPICKRETDSSPRNPHRPFCSERCQMVDLGTWAGEGYRVAGGKVEDHEHPQDRVASEERLSREDRRRRKPPD